MPSYVPILKGKEGEFAALEALTEEIGAQITPLIEIPAIPFNFSTGKKAKTLDEHLRTLPDRLQRCWGDRPFYIETPYFGEDEQVEDDRCALEVLLHNFATSHLSPIPVLSTSSSLECRTAVRAFLATGASACIRLSLDDFSEDIDTADEVTRLLNDIGKESATGLDLIVDFGALATEAPTSLLLARSVLSMIPTLRAWNTIIFAAASFPEDLSGVNSASVDTLPRREWLLWKALQRKPGLLPPNLIFSDYAISHPIPRELDPRIMRMSANIRYTTVEHWLIMKGRNVTQYGFEQYFELCRRLIERPEYTGREFSWADEFIWKCAHHEAGPGNATTWRKVGVNHHITFVVRQLANSL